LPVLVSVETRIREAREQSFRFLLHDRDCKFGGAFDEVFRGEGMRIIRTPIRAPNANAYAERWVGTLRRECLDRILIVGRRHLQHVAATYTLHYNEHRPHRSLGQRPPLAQLPPSALMHKASSSGSIGSVVATGSAA
jgi:transposase InsO family protein